MNNGRVLVNHQVSGVHQGLPAIKLGELEGVQEDVKVDEVEAIPTERVESRHGYDFRQRWAKKGGE